MMPISWWLILRKKSPSARDALYRQSGRTWEWLKLLLLAYVDILRRNGKILKCFSVLKKAGLNGFSELDMAIRMSGDHFAVIQTVQGLMLTRLLDSIMQYCITYFRGMSWKWRGLLWSVPLFFTLRLQSLRHNINPHGNDGGTVRLLSGKNLPIIDSTWIIWSLRTSAPIDSNLIYTADASPSRFPSQNPANGRPCAGLELSSSSHGCSPSLAASHRYDTFLR